jgi:hypothetical protein
MGYLRHHFVNGTVSEDVNSFQCHVDNLEVGGIEALRNIFILEGPAVLKGRQCHESGD